MAIPTPRLRIACTIQLHKASRAANRADRLLDCGASPVQAWRVRTVMLLARASAVTTRRIRRRAERRSGWRVSFAYAGTRTPWSLHAGLPSVREALPARHSRRGSTLQTTTLHSLDDRSRSTAAGWAPLRVCAAHLSSCGRQVNGPRLAPRQPRSCFGSEDRCEEIVLSTRSVPGYFVWQGGPQGWARPPESFAFRIASKQNSKRKEGRG